MSAVTPVATARATARVPARFRADVQALRTIAITAVVLNHLWPRLVPGGYIGVDVFFVISGFLITGHLFRELADTGRIRLGAFYARRIRRLLPAALLVLAVSTVLVVIFLPYPRWDRNAGEIAASAAYVENWFLSAMSVNYSALNDSASVAQHYWSLSVEEQFYLVWPLLLLAALAIASRRSVSLRTRAGLALAVVGIGSFVASVIYTHVAPAQAYFATFTRAWEFAVGGAVALYAAKWPIGRVSAGILAAAGLAAIVATAVLYDSATPFPGTLAAIPVLGTAAIIVAGTGRDRMWHSPLSASAPVQWVGAASYSLYLWHWPLIVIAPFALGRELNAPMRLGILAVALVLAGLTRSFVEAPALRWNWWARSVRRSMTAMLIGMAVVLVGAGALFAAYQLRAAADSPTAELPTGSCVGPAALANPGACPDRFGPAESVVMTAKNEYFYTPPECGQMLDIFKAGDKLTTYRCDFSGGAPKERVWLVGDSHAQQWQGAVFELARKRGWEVTTSYLGGCPVADVTFRGFRTPWGAADADTCMRWSREVSDAIAAAHPDIVFTSMAARLQLVDDGSGRPPMEQFADGLSRDWDRWAQAGSLVIPIQDPPLNGEVRDPDCVVLNASNPIECARPLAQAQPEDPIALAGQRADQSRVRPVDVTPSFCDAALCYAVVGGLPVYYDADHLNLEYVRLLAPILGAAVDAGGAAAHG